MLCFYADFFLVTSYAFLIYNWFQFEKSRAIVGRELMSNKFAIKYKIKKKLILLKIFPICLPSYENNTLKNFAFLLQRILELFTCKVCKMFVFKHTEIIEYI